MGFLAPDGRSRRARPLCPAGSCGCLRRGRGSRRRDTPCRGCRRRTAGRRSLRPFQKARCRRRKARCAAGDTPCRPFDPRRERIVRDRNGKIGVRALRHWDGVPEHALTAFRLIFPSAYRFRTERSRRQKKKKKQKWRFPLQMAGSCGKIYYLYLCAISI